MRLLGAIELIERWCFDAMHVPDMGNDNADASSRLVEAGVHVKLVLLHPEIPSKVWGLGSRGRKTCTFTLASNVVKRLLLRPRLNARIKGISVQG